MRKLRTLALASTLLAALATASATASEGADTPLAAWQADKTIVFEAPEITLEAFIWQARPLLVFADSPADPRFAEQMEFLRARPEELAARDVVIVTDTNPKASSELRRALRPRGFMLVIMSKDGQVALRKPTPWDVREITRSIDKMPLRLEEIRKQKAGG